MNTKDKKGVCWVRARAFLLFRATGEQQRTTTLGGRGGSVPDVIMISIFYRLGLRFWGTGGGGNRGVKRSGEGVSCEEREEKKKKTRVYVLLLCSALLCCKKNKRSGRIVKEEKKKKKHVLCIQHALSLLSCLTSASPPPPIPPPPSGVCRLLFFPSRPPTHLKVSAALLVRNELGVRLHPQDLLGVNLGAVLVDQGQGERHAGLHVPRLSRRLFPHHDVYPDAVVLSTLVLVPVIRRLLHHG